LKKRIVFLLFVLVTAVPALAQYTPVRYWTFDGPDSYADIVSAKQFDLRYYKCPAELIPSGKAGKGIDLKASACNAVTGELKSVVKDQLTLEFLFKGENFFWMTFAEQLCAIRFGYQGFSFRTNTLQKGKQVAHELKIELTGIGRNSYDYYMDGEWHHFVFVADGRKGKKEIWVDGELLEDGSSTMPIGEFQLGNNSGFRSTDKIDEIAIYNKALPSTLIRQHREELTAGRKYGFKPTNSSVKNSTPATKTAKKIYDEKEFAPGYPNYNVQATDQLKSFPSPRIWRSVSLRRNMSWMDITYLHRELPSAGGKGFGKNNPQRAVELSAEMAENWNYYLDIPILRTTADAAQKQYSDKNSVIGALIDFANRNPQYPVASVLVQVQGRPSHAGLEKSQAFISAQDLPDRYYFRSASGKPVVYRNKKWLSPLADLDIVKKDGKTTRFYVDQLMKYLKRPPALLNENGEYFGHIRPEELLKMDPAVWNAYKKSGLTVGQFSGRFQNRLDSTYKATVLEGMDKGKTKLSFYNLSAFNAEYWPDYSMRRQLNSWDNKTIYSTPDFYPRYPHNWRTSMGSYNGYATIAEGRTREIELGDTRFSPFVGAGWGTEESNIRPAQWLALLKSMMMLGADFFYVGYFNVTGAGGKWPDGAGPNDPRGYAYQIAMPVYAQAILSWAPEFFEQGQLLNPTPTSDKQRQYRFKGNGEDELILVRKMGKKYLIYGSLQQLSNYKGSVSLSRITTISLEGKELRFEIRRQGSVYILDLSGKDPIFYQLDGWHQFEYPSYWADEYSIEAEMFGRGSGNPQRITENLSGGFDFTNFTTYCRLRPQESVEYEVAEKWQDRKYVSIRARGMKGSGSLLIKNLRTGASAKISVAANAWQDYRINDIARQLGGGTLMISCLEGEVHLDKIVIR